MNHTLHTSFMIDSKDLYPTKSDSLGNFVIYHVTDRRSEAMKSYSGNVVRQADFHLASQITSILPISLSDEQCINVILTAEGAMGVFLFVTGEEYTKLSSLQKRLIEALPQNAALNNFNFRKYVSDGMMKYPRRKGVLDMGIIRKYLMLSTQEQEDIAKSLDLETKEITEVISRTDKLLYKMF